MFYWNLFSIFFKRGTVFLTACMLHLAFPLEGGRRKEEGKMRKEDGGKKKEDGVRRK